MRGTAVERWLARDYWSALGVSTTTQALTGVPALIATDAGVLLQFWSFAMAGYWTLFALFVARRPTSPTRLDVTLVKWGFLLLLLLVVPLVSILVWRLRY